MIETSIRTVKYGMVTLNESNPLCSPTFHAASLAKQCGRCPAIVPVGVKICPECRCEEFVPLNIINWED